MKNPKKSLFFLSVLLIGTVLTLVCTACSSPTSGNKDYTVKYEITGPATVATSVLYNIDAGGSKQLNDVNIPWSYTVTVGKNMPVGYVVSFDKTNENTYTAKIYINGKEAASSSGIHAVAVTAATQ
jgi:hypothetical protein